jgi:hypothetical protein
MARELEEFPRNSQVLRVVDRWKFAELLLANAVGEVTNQRGRDLEVHGKGTERCFDG